MSASQMNPLQYLGLWTTVFHWSCIQSLPILSAHTIDLLMGPLTSETDMSEWTILVGLSTVVALANVSVPLVKPPGRCSTLDGFTLSQHTIQEGGCWFEIIEGESVVTGEHHLEGFVNLNDGLDTPTPSEMKDLLHSALIVGEFSGSMWIGEDDCLSVAVEGSHPSRFWGNQSLGLDLVDNELEVVSGMNDFLICGITAPDCKELPKIDVLVKKDGFPQWGWEVRSSNPSFEMSECIFLNVSESHLSFHQAVGSGMCASSHTHHCGSWRDVWPPHPLYHLLSHCNDQFPQRQESPQGPADLGSAIGLAPQSPGLLGGLRDGMGVS